VGQFPQLQHLIPDPIASVQLLCIATHLTHHVRRCIGSGISSGS